MLLLRLEGLALEYSVYSALSRQWDPMFAAMGASRKNLCALDRVL